MTSLSQVVLRQAEARTQLVVDCAGLVRRLEQLDAEIEQYDQWQRSPGTDYDARVKARFEEARAREALEAKKRGCATMVSGSSEISGWAKPHTTLRPPSASGLSTSEKEQQLAIAHLQRAFRAADCEAETWRNRAQVLELANEREREQAKRLMQFELKVALEAADKTQAQLISQMRDRDAEWEKMEEAYQAIQHDCDAKRELLIDAAKQADKREAELRYLKDSVAAKHAELTVAETQFRAAQRDSEADRSKINEIEAELRCANSYQTAQMQAFEKCQAEVNHLANIASSREADLVEAHRKVDEAEQEKDQFCENLRVVRSEMQEAQLEMALEVERATDARRRLELVHAKCDNLEAALANATAKQADLAMERNTHEERANRLEQASCRLRRDLEEVKERLAHDPRTKPLDVTTSSAASTMICSTTSSIHSSPNVSRPALPPVRPPSASKTPAMVRRDNMIL
eukprot:TRINITY_DN19030_c1_g1_i1.p1 TRINITY_DN19030_c1_g1~~TRINITY_DN19030_c1_g1_i1.p1  ORF type:complete len:460 (+),score=82.74 TRINITY_DN19030_c1_g1_i1:266-1645(+)